MSWYMIGYVKVSCRLLFFEDGLCFILLSSKVWKKETHSGNNMSESVFDNYFVFKDHWKKQRKAVYALILQSVLLFSKYIHEL